MVRSSLLGKKSQSMYILDQGTAGEGMSLTGRLQIQTLRFANSQPLIKKALYNMDSKYKLESVFNFHNLCSVFGRKHGKLTTKRGKVTDYVANFTFCCINSYTYWWHTQSWLGTWKIYMPCRHLGRQVSCGETPLLQSPHENELCAELHSTIIWTRIWKYVFIANKR